MLIFSPEQQPARGAVAAEDANLRQLLYGRRRDAYRVIYAIDERDHIVTVLHIRHGARNEIRSDADE